MHSPRLAERPKHSSYNDESVLRCADKELDSRGSPESHGIAAEAGLLHHRHFLTCRYRTTASEDVMNRSLPLGISGKDRFQRSPALPWYSCCTPALHL